MSAARRPVLGRDDVARFLLGVVAKNAGLRVREVRTGDGLAHCFTDGSQTRALLNLRVRGGRVRDVWIQLNPGKLNAWGLDAPGR